jgi:hypothetical protein
MTYVLDANVFIQAARRHYAFDLAPGFWEGLDHFASERRVCSIDRVDDELRDADLREWIDGGGFRDGFASTNSTAMASTYGRIMGWVHSQTQFTDSAKEEFASGADGWLIAYAKLMKMTVVTHEILRPDVKRKVPIPNVCQAFSVIYIDTFAMLRALGFRLRR